MAKGKNGGAGEGVGKSVYLFSVDEVNGEATLVRMPFDTADNEGKTLVRTSEDVIRAVTDATLAKYPADVQRALSNLVRQSVRSQVRGADAFSSTTIALELPNTDTKKAKKDKGLDLNEVEDVAIDTSESTFDQGAGGTPWQS